VYGLDPLAEGERLHGRTGVLRERVDLDARLNGWEHLHHATGGIDAPTDPTALLERVGVRPATARRPAETYSTGTARRVGLAMALVGDPDLLVVEEPTAGLDPSGVLRVRSVLREAAASETTLFLVARRWSAAFEGCDRIARLTDGRVGRVVPVGADGSPDCDEVLELRVDRVPSISLEGIPGVETVATGAGRVSAVVSDPAAKAAVVLEVAHADVAVEDIRVRPVGSLVGPLDEPKTTYEEQ
jgi:ABC-2 type transport system ATP-binding protein